MFGSTLHRQTFALLPTKKQAWISLMTLLAATGLAGAAIPTEPAARAKLVGQPLALLVQPESITLNGPRAMQQLVVTGRYADGSVRDLTPFCEFGVESQIA